MSFFFNMIDAASVAAYILWMTKNPQWNDAKKYRRRLFLEQLGRGLIDAHLNQHCQNPHALQQKVRWAMQSLGLSITSPISTTSGTNERQRCHICPRSRDKKVATRCSTCYFPCCSDHHRIICNSCFESFDG